MSANGASASGGANSHSAAGDWATSWAASGGAGAGAAMAGNIQGGFGRIAMIKSMEMAGKGGGGGAPGGGIGGGSGGGGGGGCMGSGSVGMCVSNFFFLALRLRRIISARLMAACCPQSQAHFGMPDACEPTVPVWLRPAFWKVPLLILRDLKASFMSCMGSSASVLGSMAGTAANVAANVMGFSR